MKNLKSFKIFETTQDKLGEIQDLIEIEILDEYDSELIILGMGGN
jgi:CHAD domain-containing protein